MVGLSAMIVPVPFTSNFRIDTIVAIAAGVMLLCSLKQKKLVRRHGIAMLLCYGAYFLYLL